MTTRDPDPLILFGEPVFSPQFGLHHCRIKRFRVPRVLRVLPEAFDFVTILGNEPGIRRSRRGLARVNNTGLSAHLATTDLPLCDPTDSGIPQIVTAFVNLICDNEPLEAGFLGDLGAPDGENIFESDDMNECRQSATAELEE